MKQIFVLAALWTMAVTAGAQTATTFEMRFFTPDAAADGVTDFHGETEWYSTPQRVEMLGKYARFASRFWGGPGLDTPLFGESDVTETLSRIKPQPLTTVRQTLPMEHWRAIGYKKGKEADVKENTPERFEEALRRAKAWVDARPGLHPLITINSWNEWTETSYLQPDNVNGYGYLDAVRNVFVESRGVNR